MEIIKPEAEEKDLLPFSPYPPVSHKVVELEGLHKSYENLRFLTVWTCELRDRIAVVGVNGREIYLGTNSCGG